MSLENALKPGTPLHKRIRTGIRERKNLAKNRLADRYEGWRTVEDEAAAYIKETTESYKRRKKQEQGIPEYRTVVFPFSVAIQLTALTYWTSVFLSRNPVFQFTSRNSSGQMKVQNMEAVVDYQINVGRGLVPLYVWLADAAKYGFGVVGIHWDETHTRVSKIERVEKLAFGAIPTGKFEEQRVTEQVLSYAGNRLYNIRPQDFFPDPRVSIVNFQKGEFCGRFLEVGWNTILKGQKSEDNPEGYFNIEALRAHRKKGAADRSGRDMGSERLPIPQDSNTPVDEITSDVGFVNLMEMHIELSPKEWGLGTSEYPERWVFTLAEDEIIIGARPLGEFHDQFPFATLLTEIEGHGVYTRSMLEMEKPLNDVLTWLLNSHFYNVRKALNDMFLVDPNKVEMRDLLDPAPGKLVRLKSSFGGTDVRSVLTQFPVVDVTQTHLRDMQMVMDVMQRTMGVNETVMGQVNPGGRKSATEIRSSSSFSINRMKALAEYMSAVGFQPLGEMFAQSTQQHLETELELRIAGRNLGQEEYVTINAQEIEGAFDFVPVDGTFPIDRFAQANLWRQIMVDMSTNPLLMQKYSPAKVFEWIAKLQGVRNLTQFENTQPGMMGIEVQPDAQIQKGVQAGDLIPQPTQLTEVGAVGPRE